MQELLLDFAGGAGEKPKAAVEPDRERLARAAYRNEGYDEDRLAELDAMPIVDLAMLHHDMLESDDDWDCRSRRTRQIAAAIKRRGLSREELDAAYVEALRGV